MSQKNQSKTNSIVIGTNDYSILTDEFFLATKEVIANNLDITEISFVIITSRNSINNAMDNYNLYYNVVITTNLLNNKDDIDEITIKTIIDLYNEYKKYLKLH